MTTQYTKNGGRVSGFARKQAGVSHSLVGVDEVGRGCWAGPLLVVAARATADLPAGLKDSKLLTKLQREKLLNMLSNCCNFGEGWVKAVEIDTLGLARALKLGVARSLKDLGVGLNEEIIMDGKVNYIPKKFLKAQVLVGADNIIPVVSAASVCAKVKRDSYMLKLHKKHPDYNFASHAGYGTKQHQEALKLYGALKYVHRFSYAPIEAIG